MSELTTRERIPAVAARDFRDSWEGLPVTPEQEGYLRLAEMWDQPTLNAFADVIRLARAERGNTACTCSPYFGCSESPDCPRHASAATLEVGE